MFDFQQKRRLRAILESRFIWGVLLLIMCLLVVSAYERYTIAEEMADRRAVAEEELSRLRAREAELSAQVEYLSHERGMEAEMRRQFDVALPGEEIVIIMDEPAESGSGAASDTGAVSTTSTQSRPWYRFW